MNRLVVVLSTAIIILSVVSGFLFYQLSVQSNSALNSQIAELQNQIDTIEARLGGYPNLVKIADIEVYGFAPLSGLTIQSAVDVTIENIGVNDVEGLTLNAVHSSQADYPYTKNVDVLHAGEKRKINSYVFWTVTTIGTITITLNLGNVTLDEYILENYNIPPFH